MRSGTIHFAKLAEFIICGCFERDGITSQMERYFSVLLSSILLCHIALCFFICLYFVFIIIFVTKFSKDSLGEILLLS